MIAAAPQLCMRERYPMLSHQLYVYLSPLNLISPVVALRVKT
jgi:hypothetical protein